MLSFSDLGYIGTPSNVDFHRAVIKEVEDRINTHSFAFVDLKVAFEHLNNCTKYGYGAIYLFPYEIYNKATKDVVKTGISGQKLNQNGTSPRAYPQVSRLNANAGESLYDARIVHRMPNRQSALEWEREHALRLWNQGHSMSIHLRPRPWEDKR